MQRFLVFTMSVVIVAVAGVGYAGVYAPPAGGWTYIYTGDAATAGAGGNFDSLDDTWDHNNGSDEWDGSAIGAGNPGGASALSEDSTNYLRLQDTGDPRGNGGIGDPGSNRKLFFGHKISADDNTNAILDDGLTLSFRARIATTPPLDNLHWRNGSPAPAPWPAGGDGYVIHDGGKGIGAKQGTGGCVGFHLATAADLDGIGDSLPAGLIMNTLNGTSVTGDVDPTDGSHGTINLLPLDPTVWHEFWITIEADSTGGGTHLAKIYMDGSLVPNEFDVTAGSGSDYPDKNSFAGSYMIMELGSTGQSGAVDIDFMSYKEGAIAPIPEPATFCLAAIGLLVLGLYGWRRRRTA